ncbi:hypothetical protein CSUI_000419 [Cystoisospora suis]|uniref:Uncharacterized protein n=1 Tax=Cystoisospora suis TaxID=483139 RepID=A0A2C6LE50_9APIC|nr:hypothetical protein CSUI_000419 [Cystoisospora suis]
MYPFLPSDVRDRRVVSPAMDLSDRSPASCQEKARTSESRHADRICQPLAVPATGLAASADGRSGSPADVHCGFSRPLTASHHRQSGGSVRPRSRASASTPGIPGNESGASDSRVAPLSSSQASHSGFRPRPDASSSYSPGALASSREISSRPRDGASSFLESASHTTASSFFNSSVSLLSSSPCPSQAVGVPSFVAELHPTKTELLQSLAHMLLAMRSQRVAFGWQLSQVERLIAQLAEIPPDLSEAEHTGDLSSHSPVHPGAAQRFFFDHHDTGSRMSRIRSRSAPTCGMGSRAAGAPEAATVMAQKSKRSPTGDADQDFSAAKDTSSSETTRRGGVEIGSLFLVGSGIRTSVGSSSTRGDSSISLSSSLPVSHSLLSSVAHPSVRSLQHPGTCSHPRPVDRDRLSVLAGREGTPVEADSSEGCPAGAARGPPAEVSPASSVYQGRLAFSQGNEARSRGRCRSLNAPRQGRGFEELTGLQVRIQQMRRAVQLGVQFDDAYSLAKGDSAWSDPGGVDYGDEVRGHSGLGERRQEVVAKASGTTEQQREATGNTRNASGEGKGEVQCTNYEPEVKCHKRRDVGDDTRDTAMGEKEGDDGVDIGGENSADRGPLELDDLTAPVAHAPDLQGSCTSERKEVLHDRMGNIEETAHSQLPVGEAHVPPSSRSSRLCEGDKQEQQQSAEIHGRGDSYLRPGGQLLELYREQHRLLQDELERRKRDIARIERIRQLQRQLMFFEPTRKKQGSQLPRQVGDSTPDTQGFSLGERRTFRKADSVAVEGSSSDGHNDAEPLRVVQEDRTRPLFPGIFPFSPDGQSPCHQAVGPPHSRPMLHSDDRPLPVSSSVYSVNRQRSTSISRADHGEPQPTQEIDAPQSLNRSPSRAKARKTVPLPTRFLTDMMRDSAFTLRHPPLPSSPKLSSLRSRLVGPTGAGHNRFVPPYSDIACALQHRPKSDQAYPISFVKGQSGHLSASLLSHFCSSDPQPLPRIPPDRMQDSRGRSLDKTSHGVSGQGRDERERRLSAHGSAAGVATPLCGGRTAGPRPPLRDLGGGAEPALIVARPPLRGDPHALRMNSRLFHSDTVGLDEQMPRPACPVVLSPTAVQSLGTLHRRDLPRGQVSSAGTGGSPADNISQCLCEGCHPAHQCTKYAFTGPDYGREDRVMIPECRRVTRGVPPGDLNPSGDLYGGQVIPSGAEGPGSDLRVGGTGFDWDNLIHADATLGEDSRRFQTAADGGSFERPTENNARREHAQVQLDLGSSRLWREESPVAYVLYSPSRRGQQTRRLVPSSANVPAATVQRGSSKIRSSRSPTAEFRTPEESRATVSVCAKAVSFGCVGEAYGAPSDRLRTRKLDGAGKGAPGCDRETQFVTSRLSHLAASSDVRKTSVRDCRSSVAVDSAACLSWSKSLRSGDCSTQRRGRSATSINQSQSPARRAEATLDREPVARPTRQREPRVSKLPAVSSSSSIPARSCHVASFDLNRLGVSPAAARFASGAQLRHGRTTNVNKMLTRGQVPGHGDTRRARERVSVPDSEELDSSTAQPVHVRLRLHVPSDGDPSGRLAPPLTVRVLDPETQKQSFQQGQKYLNKLSVALPEDETVTAVVSEGDIALAVVRVRLAGDT